MDYDRYLTESSEPEARPEPKGAKKPGLWDLLSTMKFAIWILVLLGVLSLVALFAGELQDPESLRQPARSTGQAIGRLLLILFQMDDPFRSWWYRLLLGVLCLSLFACVLERTPIIWRLWTKQPPQSADWLKNIRHGVARTVGAPRERLLRHLGGWNWRHKSEDLWIGERGRLAMWGPLLTHVGLLLLGIGALIGSFGGIKTRAGGFAGDTLRVEGVPFAVYIDSFRVEYYPLQPGQWVQVDDEGGPWVGRLEREQSDGSWLVRQPTRENQEGEIVPATADRIRNRFNSDMDRANIQRYVSWVRVLEDGQDVLQREVVVNAPLRHRGYRFYQSSYDPENPRFQASYQELRLAVTDTAGRGVDTLALKPGVATPIPGDTLTVEAAQMLPHFKISQQGPYSESAHFVNPAVRLIFRGPNGYEKSQWVFLKFPGMDRGPGRYVYRLAGLSGERASEELMTIFEVKRTNGGWILWLGFLLGTLGLLLSSYLFHRVLYVEWTAEGGQTRLTGLSRKTSALFGRQLDRMIEQLNHEAAS